jgi:hypothetical protein
VCCVDVKVSCRSKWDPQSILSPGFLADLADLQHFLLSMGSCATAFVSRWDAVDLVEFAGYGKRCVATPTCF